jgi:hypothetical protein
LVSSLREKSENDSVIPDTTFALIVKKITSRLDVGVQRYVNFFLGHAQDED